MEQDPLLLSSSVSSVINGSSTTSSNGVILPQQMGIYITENKSMMNEMEQEASKNGVHVRADANFLAAKSLRKKAESLDQSLQRTVWKLTAGGWFLYFLFAGGLIALALVDQVNEVVHQALLVFLAVLFTVVDRLKLTARISDYETHIKDVKTLIREVSSIEMLFYLPSPTISAPDSTTQMATKIRTLWGTYDEIALRISTAPPKAEAFSINQYQHPTSSIN